MLLILFHILSLPICLPSQGQSSSTHKIITSHQKNLHSFLILAPQPVSSHMTYSFSDFQIGLHHSTKLKMHVRITAVCWGFFYLLLHTAETHHQSKKVPAVITVAVAKKYFTNAKHSKLSPLLSQRLMQLPNPQGRRNNKNVLTGKYEQKYLC